MGNKSNLIFLKYTHTRKLKKLNGTYGSSKSSQGFRFEALNEIYLLGNVDPKIMLALLPFRVEMLWRPILIF